MFILRRYNHDRARQGSLQRQCRPTSADPFHNYEFKLSQTCSGEYNINVFQSTVNATVRTRTGHYFWITTKRVSVLKLRLAKPMITLPQLTSALRLLDQPMLGCMATVLACDGGYNINIRQHSLKRTVFLELSKIFV